MSKPNSELTHEHFESELVIGLVAAVGAETHLVVDLLKETLGLAGYEVSVIKISEDVIPDLVTPKDYGSDKFLRYMSLMQAGNDARRKARDNSILALGASTYIAKHRREYHPEKKKLSGDQSADASMPRTAFIIDSLKRPEEVEKLRIIYPSGFVLFGIHDEEIRRERNLKKTKGMKKKEAATLIKRDRDETADDYGQRVNSTFHLADFFVHATGSYDRLRCDLRRMVELCFGNPYLTPTFDELAMFQAFASALRSSDLSRQVGAVIARADQILATGANDCPKAGGGLYWPYRKSDVGCIEDDQRGRDFVRGFDSNKREQLKIAKRIAKQLSREYETLKWKEVRDTLLKGDIRDLTEYGRVVHAEMEALLSCARQGISTSDADLYSTTFPCHNCAKHIIAGGIRRVVYVEPYAKSKALEFHDDAILTPGQNCGIKQERVRFEPFVGVGPRRFFELFSMHLGSSYPVRRKNSETGEKLKWRLQDARLRLQMKPVSYLQLEELAEQRFLSVTNQEGAKDDPRRNEAAS